MKDNVLQQLLSDPNFDPTAWLGDAIKEYVADNPSIVLADEVCFKYVIKGMEYNDWRNIARYLPENPECFAAFIKKTENDKNKGDKSSNGDRFYYVNRTHKILQERVEKSADPKLALTLLEIEGLLKMPEDSKALLDLYDDNGLLRLVNQWSTKNWSRQDWKNLVARLSPSALEELIENPNFPRKLCYNFGPRVKDEGGGEANERIKQIVTAQNVLIDILLKLDPSDLHIWPEVLKRFTPKILKVAYSDYYSGTGRNREIVHDERICRRKLVGYESDYYGRNCGVYEDANYEPEFNELMCRCGYMTNNKSSYKLHHKKCDKQNQLSLGLISRLVLARNGITSNVCQKCGRKCSTQSGLTLHKKRCNVEITGYDLRRGI